MTDEEELTWKQKFDALVRVARYRPGFTVGLVFLGGFVALLEGIGLGFIYPIIEVAQADGPVDSGGPVLGTFISVYQFVGVPFELEFLLLGVALAMTFRFVMSFITAWLKAILAREYEKNLRKRAFDRALDAEVGYFDDEGSDDVLNAIITETRYSGKVIEKAVVAMETTFLVLMYFAVMFYIAPGMTILAIVLLGSITLLIRFVVEPAVTVGTRVAEANEKVQETVQAGTQGIRDVKLFGLSDEVFETFNNAVNRFARSEVSMSRNRSAVQNFYELSAALMIFVLIYVGFVFTGLQLGELGVFLIAMFQLAPRVSRLNSQLYNLEGHIAHLIRTQDFLDELDQRLEEHGDRSVDAVEEIEVEDVHFSYGDDEKVLDGISFDVEKSEFIAFVGQSGAGKSTIVALLARLYDPDAGIIRADGTPIEEFDLQEWRERIAVVRQQPFIFNDTLEKNITVGNRDASRQKVKRVCEIAQVTEFLNELPEGYDSDLGDEGVRLSGGQRQRVALARALLKNADFLVLDEATSDLDSNLERKVQESIESMDQEYGIIAIAHRLSTVKNADQIYTVEDGSIVEEGTHGELLSADGPYAGLYSLQSEG